MADKVAALRRTALFGELEEAPLEALADRAVERHLTRGEELFGAGEEARGLYVVVAGSLKAFRMSVDGREQVIHVEREGATIAEVPVFDDGKTPSTVAAETDAVVLFIDKRDVRRLCLEHPGIALAALKVLAGRLRRCSDLVATLSLQDVGQRLARFLLSEASVRGERTDAGLVLDLPLTKEQIATRIGSVREVVSRAFTRLQNDGLVAVDGHRVTILDEGALRAYVEG
jgi:CRP/FNR family transcriptional regulator